MDNESENTDGLEPAPMGVEGAGSSTGVALPADDAANARARRVRKPLTQDELDEQRRRDLHASFNRRISYLCKLAALIIAVVAFATIALGQEVPAYVLMGLCLSVALLAIAMLQDHYQHKQ
ncbi:SoxR reducing system RseC family protein [Gordonibacter massiliensis (ex Traore et al. 2017)]|uniref:Propionyl-CoA carboxylase subunit beta n=1 Tax=Gordonibacter massiliensis (ex Traore et al. 2017) TaxID=1841863 RepID=A0A842JBX0_9ACTN|nr:SoxR reducing system RseC family protein [Gordonibacter massiliensis (ex Traore et al. 2017)]MBC2889702.1 propionyl-CoA carboxylase subunit beta [Gordonibacter massiliensis (ex Traore et al. 2017)]MBX9034359.1 SoxR reducing system RseC family protein [Gordonibacter massiliensis (ex Traore et al. 2017)]